MVPDELRSGEIDELKAALVALRGELEQLLSLSRDGARPVDLDEPIGRLSRMDALQQQSMLAANRSAAQRRLQQVESALRRVESDDYGLCLICGEPIGVGRLRAQPEAPLCVACQGRREGR